MSRLASAGEVFLVRAFISPFFHSPTSRWALLLSLACFASASIPLSDIAEARHRYRSAPERTVKADDPAPPAGPLFFVISLNNQHVSVYSNDGLYERSPVSTGQPGHPTPRGIFTIVGKERMHHSNIYSGAPMPYMQRITWSGVAMHEGVLPGYAASHGCIRLPHDFARRMFGITQGNERVIISRQDIAPAPFAHPKLPLPALLPAPGAGAVASISERLLQNAMASARGESDTSPLEMVAAKADDAPGVEQKLLNPHDYAKAMRARAAKRAEEAAASASPARAAIEAKSREIHVALVDLKKAQIALSGAKDRLANAERQVTKASGEEAVNAATAAKNEAEAKVKEAEALVEAAERAKAQKDSEFAVAVRTFKDLDAAQKAAADSVKQWTRRLSPVSIFISRKTQRLYVRQNFIKVFDVPVTIRDSEKPLGTHLFLAMQPLKCAPDAEPKLRWLSLTIPEAAGGERPRRHRSRYYDDEDEGETAVAAPAISAAAALDRIDIPAEVSGKISEMLWAGGALIVSDSGVSDETDDYTDFVVLTR
jgi:hypothetical protein